MFEKEENIPQVVLVQFFMVEGKNITAFLSLKELNELGENFKKEKNNFSFTSSGTFHLLNMSKIIRIEIATSHYKSTMTPEIIDLFNVIKDRIKFEVNYFPMF